MKSHSNLITILLSNNWQENFNTWEFQESVIIVKKYSRPAATKLVQYSIEETQDRLVIRTKNEDFGDLILELQNRDPLPKLILQSTKNLKRRFVLEAFIRFSKEQKMLITTQVNRLKEIFHSKRNEINERIFDGNAKSNNNNKSLADYEVALQQMARKIAIIETVVNATVDIASNFERYYENISTDVNNLIKEIESI